MMAPPPLAAAADEPGQTRCSSSSGGWAGAQQQQQRPPPQQQPSAAAAAGPVAAVQALLQRVLPEHAQLFALALAPPSPAAPHGCFSVEVRDGTVHVAGTSGVELASGVHWFLKHVACCSLSWHATGGLQVNAASLVQATQQARAKASIHRAVPWTWYMNVVTQSYSMAFWDWDRWEAELDWMALQGINLPMMPLGMEALLQRTFVGLGLTRQQLADFFPGPAFLAWGRMGNIQGWAGPLPQAYMDSQLALAHRVVGRMRALGMTPVFPAFAGYIPAALQRLHPEASAAPASTWCHFPPGYCCPLLLDPADPLFGHIGGAYITTLRAELGWDAGGSYYIADTFNEMRPGSADPAYLSSIAASVYGGMTAADPGAHWVMQAWLFFSDSRFWQPPQIQALLSGVPRGRLLLLDLFADEHPVWSRTASLYGHPFIWCMLHNFGGNSGMYGALPAVARGVADALATAPSNLVGVGVAPEGIEQNPAVYEFMAELAYEGRAAAAAAPGGLQTWFRAYADRRYAAAGPLPPPVLAALQGAWSLLARSVYSCADGLHNTVCDIPTSRPGLCKAEIMGWGLQPHLWYDVGDLRAAWELLLQAGRGAAQLTAGGPAASSAFVYDLVDVSRELLSKMAGRFWADAVAAYQAGRLAELRTAGGSLTALLSDMDTLLGAHHGFMLGPHLQRARDYVAVAPDSSSNGTSSQQQQQQDADCDMPDADGSSAPGTCSSSSSEQQQLGAFYAWNLRTQLSVWGTSAPAGDSEVSDYANKEWAGLISSFYLPRWRAWLERLEADLVAGRPYDAPAWRLQVLTMTSSWIATGRTRQPPEEGGSSSSSSECSAEAEALPLVPRGDALQLSARAYDRYARQLAPGCAATAATAAAAAAAAAAGLPAPPSGAAVAATATATATAAAVAVVGAAAAVAAAEMAPANAHTPSVVAGVAA